MNRNAQFAIGTAAAAVGLLAAPEAVAQGCAMCYASAEASGPEAARSLNLGILALLSPTLLLFGGIFYLANRRAHRSDDNQT